MKELNKVSGTATKSMRPLGPIRSMFAALALSTLVAHADEPMKTTLQSTTIVSGDDISEKVSLEIKQITETGDITGYITHGKDIRINPEEFTSGGINISSGNLSYGFRGLLLGDDAHGEAYGKIKHRFRLKNTDVDTWARLGLTMPEWVSISAGVSIPVGEDTTLSGLVSHKEDTSGKWPEGTLVKAEISHKITPEVTVYAGVDHWTGDDSSYTASNTLDQNGPGFTRFALHGQGLTGNVGIKHTGKKWMTTHLKASYNEHDYWNFVGEVSKEIGKNTTISAGVLVDTREEVDTTGFIGIKKVF